MSYRIELTTRAQRFFKKLDKGEQIRIRNKLRNLKNNPKLGKALTADLTGLWSLRMGKYRIIYEIKHDELLILIIDMGHRKNIYR